MLRTRRIGRDCVKTHRAADLPESASRFRGRTHDSERSTSIESQSIALSRNRLRVFTQSRPEADGCRSQAAGVGSVSISRSIPCRLGQRRTSSARVPRRSRALTARAPAVFILSRVGCNLQLPVVLASGANAGDLPSIATPQRAPKRYIKPALIMKTSLSWNATSESPSPHSTLPTACQRPLSNGSR